MNKTVYFLGAGFSADAGGPIQNGIIKTIFSDDFKNFHVGNKAIDNFENFIRVDLGVSDNLRDYIDLEDVFTPIDRAISTGKSFKVYDTKKLVSLREEFHFLMGAAIQFGVDRKGRNSNYIDEFASYIDDLAKIRLKEDKEDILLDNALNNFVRSYSAIEKSSNSEKIAVVDYCCYMSSLDKDDHFIKPGLLALGGGGYNIKYLKLHGSMNWLHCPMCQRMFVKYYEKTMFSGIKYCRHCQKNYKLNDINAIRLNSNLLLPTFIKDLSNIQIQLIWQNAGIELAEASKVVFIGYSLPSADYEIRQLLSRCIPKHTKVEVVLYPGNPSSSKEDVKKNKDRIEADKNRFKIFFGDRIESDNNFIIKTVPEYIASLKQ